MLLTGLAILVAGLLFWHSHSVKTAYVNGLPAYRDLPGREFIFERECYIFKLKNRATDWPLVGDHLVVPELPAEVTSANIGADLPGVRILGLAHVGERFRLVSVRQETQGAQQHLSFEILFDEEASHPYTRMDADLIMDHAPEAQGLAPALRPEYAVDSPRQ